MSLDREQEMERKQEMEDVRVEEALRSFRGSVRAWSDAEFANPRVVRRSRWSAFWMLLATPAASGALAVLLAAGSIGVPVAVYHERQVEAQHLAEIDRQKQAEAAEMARQRAAQAVNDVDLLTDVDSDVAQEAPEAMQPLAGLMSESGASEISK